ncbi:peptide deformylase [Mycoplasmoides pneumoniae]|uniref:peptide deformylase n=1 Tax=Mycoplasmoides pneumoniae TaxID=2104 RepID=UPI0006BA6A9E|nr:peptide deformylase [Mycoplasmoides pneumoniae]
MELLPTKAWLVLDDVKEINEPTKPVQFPLDQASLDCIAKMMAYVDASYNGDAEKYGIIPGIGIAANQIGYWKQMFYIHLMDGGVEHKCLLINPKIINLSANKSFLKSGEGCLSVLKMHQGYVIRHEWITITGFDWLQQKEITITATGLFGMCLQHEFDHLQGRFYYHRINPLNPLFTNKEWKVINPALPSDSE